MKHKTLNRRLKLGALLFLGLVVAPYSISGCSVTPIPIPGDQDAGGAVSRDGGGIDAPLSMDFGHAIDSVISPVGDGGTGKADGPRGGDGQAGDGQAGDGQAGDGQAGDGQAGDGQAADATPHADGATGQ